MEAEDLAAEYETLVLPRFDEWAALTLGFGLVETARAAGAPVVIDIRTADRVLFHVALPGATPLNDLWVARKAATALLFQKPSLLVGVEHRAKGGTLADHGLSLATHADHGGAVPVRVAGTGVVACVTVSGLPQVEDHRMAVEGLRSLKTRLDGPDPQAGV
ncbi:heme-degrading domain-containing protein [Neotabrizicola sp. VNH66]|uniref:heme-degrading domain-containing protein n=1 Tax=Neotabrizicola sp. VNH66 TaxID=3400918 RepID=UPI003BFBDA87